MDLEDQIELSSISNKASAYSPISLDDSPIALTWKDLVVKIQDKNKNQKELLRNVSGTITGGCWAILGPSGSGKTTFLSALSMRLDPFRMTMTGDVRMNGKNYSRTQLKRMSGYVMQDDLIHAHLTVRETLSITADLRMARDTTSEERVQRVEEVMKLVGIRHCQDVLVGDSRRKGISGGERKRLCIAMELLMKPKLLFLDEPTSGLDSATALVIMRILKSLSTRGECTVVTTIHQPQSKIFALFDNLILMKQGEILYQGNALGSLVYLESKGCPCPPLTNPADHLIDSIGEELDELKELEVTEKENEKRDGGGDGIDPQGLDLKEEGSAIDSASSTPSSSSSGDFPQVNPSSSLSSSSSTRFTRFEVPVDPDFGSTNPVFSLKEVQPWVVQFIVLLKRNLLFVWRRWEILAMNLFVTMVIATFIGRSVWADMGEHKSSASKRQAALFFCVIHQGIVASLQGTHSFPLERAIMLRERASGTYYVSAYYLAKTTADFLAQLPAPIIFSIMVYPMVGFQPSTKQFFIFLGFMILDSNAATSLANMISCLFVSIEMSTVVLALAYEWVRLFGGWFISPALMSSFPQWKFADALSYIKYSFVGVSLNENSSLLVTCLPSERSNPSLPDSPSNCKVSPLSTVPGLYPYTGHHFNEYYGYDSYTIGFCAGIIVAYIIGCRLISYLGLRFIKI